MDATSTTDLDSAHGTPGPGLTAVDKAMVVLTLLIESEAPLSLTELSRKAGLAKPTVHRVLAALRSHRMVARFGDKYFPGDRVSRYRAVETDFLALLRSESTPYLTELHQLTGQAASISVLTGDTVYHVNKVYGHSAVRIPSPVTGYVPTSFGDDAICRILQAYRSAPNDNTLADASLAGEMVEVRRTGIARTDDRAHGTTSIAVPVYRSGHGQPPVALAVTGRTGWFEPSETAEALRRSAFALTRRIRIAIIRWSAPRQPATAT